MTPLVDRYWALPIEWLPELGRALAAERPADSQAARRQPARRAKVAVLPVDGLLTERASWWGTSYQ